MWRLVHNFIAHLPPRQNTLNGIAVLATAAVDIASSSVSDHTAKENRVEPGKGALETGDQTPRNGKPHIGSVVNLASKTVPTVNKDSSLRRDDGLGVVDGLPGDLREGVAQNQLALLHGAEAVLLAVAAVPHPVPEEVANKHGSQDTAVPAVHIRVMVGQVDGAVAVRKRNTSQVPEDEHEAPLLVVHIPGSDDELFALGAGVGVEEVSHDEEPNLARDVAVLLMLASGGTKTEDEEDVPRHANLEEHLEVENAKHTRVQLGTHKEIIDGVSSHAVLLAAPEGREVGDNANKEAAQNGNGQKRAKLVNGSVQRPDARVMQTGKAGKGGVETPVGIAVVGKLLATLVRKRLTVAPNTREEAVEGTLNNEIRPIPGPDLETGERAGVDKVGKMGTKLAPRLTLSSRGELSVVVGSTNPHVPHENGKECHHSSSTKRATKLDLTGVVDLRVLARSPAINDVRVVRNALCLFNDGLDRGSTVGCGMAIGRMSVAVAVTIGVTIAITISMAVGLAVGGPVNSSHVV
ncbi:hypothetical protein HG531_008047 [Fusarium graminearum]|nr:hypothetical protein HG531_008047 [Fusarium graminearum]